MKNVITVVLVVLFSGTLLAQELKITGQVLDQSGPLPGASITVKGTSTVTQTDFDGFYTITASKGNILVFSYLGFITEEVQIKETAIINMLMIEDAQALEEVVVTAMGIKREKKVLGYAVSHVGLESVSRNLAGRVSGVSIVSSTRKLSKDQRIQLKEAVKPKEVSGFIYIVDDKPIAQANNSIIENIHPSDIIKKHIYTPSRAKNTFGISGNKGCIVISTRNGDYRVEDDESYARINENKFEQVLLNPLSTFSIDVDKASYSNIRRMINNGQNVNPGAVKIEEMVNYFNYDYPQPTDQHPFSISSEVSRTPWNSKTKLVRIGLQGKEYANNALPPSNLTFLIDVSGSMSDANKLPLLKSAFKLVVKQMRAQDKVAIVVYAGAAGLVLEPTSGKNKEKIYEALNNLEAGGSTAGGEGIELAYMIAVKNYIKKGNNRVILATDGDFNVGASSDLDMEKLIQNKRESGVFLSVLGFGMGNYKDSKLEVLADKGNGNHGYIDTMLEAQKVFGEEFGGTLHTIAKDVKIQVEFNPALVGAYRLIGYENRMLEAEDFIDDKKDAGELGSGHTITALYEIIPEGVAHEFTETHIPLKYTDFNIKEEFNKELMTVKFRYKKPTGTKSKEIVHKIADTETDMSEDFSFAASVALFGMHLRESVFTNSSSMLDVIPLAENGREKDENGYRAEFIRLVKTYENSL